MMRCIVVFACAALCGCETVPTATEGLERPQESAMKVRHYVEKLGPKDELFNRFDQCRATANTTVDRQIILRDWINNVAPPKKKD